MQFGDLLMAQGLIDADGLVRAAERQAVRGGGLADSLVALGLVEAARMEAVREQVPAGPRTVADTGLTLTTLLRLLLKSMLVDGFETPTDLVGRLKLPYGVVTELLRICTERQLVEALGAGGLRATELRYGLSVQGRQWAQEALDQNLYVGPAPVPHERFCVQILRQRIARERIDRAQLEDAFGNLVVPDGLIRKLGPAINAMRAMLLYGPPGNGKTTIAEKIGKIFNDIVFIPHAVEVGGQIMKLYDPSLHVAIRPGNGTAEPAAAAPRLREGDVDQRWVPCRRPVVVVGGELTLEMLDLQFNSLSRFYEAPLHVKALNGTFIIDDFGRQLVRPQDLLNRWIVPLESRVDYLKLHTGNSFQIPFDAFVIFSTNLTPQDLVDPAFLRRIPYKLEIENPSAEDYRAVFALVARGAGLELADDAFRAVLAALSDKQVPLAYYQPKFITDQVLAACKFEGSVPAYRPDLIAEALDNLYMRAKTGSGGTAARM